MLGFAKGYEGSRRVTRGRVGLQGVARGYEGLRGGYEGLRGSTISPRVRSLAYEINSEWLSPEFKSHLWQNTFWQTRPEFMSTAPLSQVVPADAGAETPLAAYASPPPPPAPPAPPAPAPAPMGGDNVSPGGEAMPSSEDG